MHDSSGTPTCSIAAPTSSTAPTRPGQSVVASIYRVKVAGRSRLVTITWCKNLLLHGLSITIQGSNDHDLKVDLKPWYFWRKAGSKNIVVEGRRIGVFWDLRAAVFEGEPEPRSGYYVAIVCGDEVVLLDGDIKKDAYRRTWCRPALAEPTLLSRTEHVSIKRRFVTAVRLGEKGKLHRVSVEWKCREEDDDQAMEICIDGCRTLHVKHLQWKFRGNESTRISGGTRLQVCWDVHDWLFGSSPRHGVFVFRAVSMDEEPSICYRPVFSEEENKSWSDREDWVADGAGFCLFVHAWKVD